MQTEEIKVRVPSKTAKAYRNAPPDEQKRIQSLITYALMSREEAAQAFERITSRISEKAKQRGLTPEKLEALLNEDDDE